ncbi:hypothetical protein MKW98_011441 [Papaver atlanticum]|uniref:Uncharacterized protein n=1 Tax=Papaver atlanticum TaxID=357466 RepID=A0AAD4TBF6_9MAGN|nr:hypothetical protein MKW98_011441 [Papaver atlanticum]
MISSFSIVIQRWHLNYDVSLTRKTKLPRIRLSTGCLKLSKGNHAKRKLKLSRSFTIGFTVEGFLLISYLTRFAWDEA